MLITSLADALGPNSFSMAPIVVAMPDGTRKLSDGRTEGGRPIGIEEERQAWKVRGAISVEALGVTCDTPFDRFVAGWVGDAFLESVVDLDAPRLAIPPAPERHRVADRGSFWVERPSDAYPRLAGFVDAAAPYALRREDKRLVDLLHWTLPCHPATEALVWYFAGDDAAKHDQIDWFLRIRDSGSDRPTDAPSYERFLRETLDAIRRRQRA